MTQPPYGQQPNPQPGYQSTPPPTSTASSRGAFSPATAIFAVIAAVLGILSLFVFGWFRDNFSSVSGGTSTSNDSKFSKLHDSLNSVQDTADAHPSIGKYLHFGISPTYFTWLGYVLIIAAVVLTFLCAASLGGLVVAIKALSALVAVVGIGATLWAIDLISADAQFKQVAGGTGAPSYSDYLKHTSFGAWAMLLAFLLCLIGSLLPPKRRIVATQPQY